MKREIKFRGLRVDGKGWVYGHYYESNGNHLIGSENLIAGCRKHNLVIPESVGQYIGIKDKKGDEIYEEDAFKGDEPGDCLIVDWNEEQAAFGLQLYGYDCHTGEGGQEVYDSEKSLLDVDFMEVSSLIDCEIIGNIHEHKHLLK